MNPTNLPLKMSEREWKVREKWLDEGFHWCSKCKQKLALLNFSKAKGTRFGYYNWCKRCHSELRKGNGRYQAKAKQYARELMLYYINLLGGKCAKCGYSKTQCALEFHHVNPDEKEFTLSKLIKSNNDLLVRFELNKCVLLCRNCHSEFESSIWSAEFAKSKLGYLIRPDTIIEHENEYWTNIPNKILFSQLSLFDTPQGGAK